MNSLIAGNQSAFIKGRNLVDGVVIVNEVVDLARRFGKECLIFKVDFEKAYDSVEWVFLEYMLKRTIKAILRGFELASSLRVNFWKSCLMGVNVREDFMETTCNSLNCIRGSIPFKYLGLPVGANPHRMSTWEPLISSLHKKLNSWNHKHISFGGSVKESHPNPKGVSMGGVNGGRKLCWIKWRVVCQQKENGRLGVRGIKAVNLSLLMKWRWRLLNSEEVGLWKEVVSRSLGNGASTCFWSDLWIGDLLVCVKFPRLFSLSLQKEVKVRELVSVEGESYNWTFTWWRRLFLWEEDRVSQLLTSLTNVKLSNEEDTWRWMLDAEGSFSVKSAYNSLLKEIVTGTNLSLFEAKFFNNIWDSPASSKVVAFSWQLLHDRVPTKENLLLCGVLPQNSDGYCVWCGDICESSSHLFLHCKVALVVWYEIFKWLGVVIVVPPNLSIFFDCLSEAANSKKSKKGFCLV
ncbi:hypothetical protein TSUD_131390 [Trifolium subterraneum]|uniref:Reverse transcriptase zinc-binding domain-containing protein n=1 Tax=Trifolium subterraneum TaxID=3900 RepID=A0A2Z6P7B1_TRISU|nr:hypothetical protein TSUD_131390 [Trifolium subterraneum]